MLVSHRMKRPMTSTDHDSYIRELGLQLEGSDPQLSTGERIIRAVLLFGFVVVLAVEAFLLWQAWQLMG